MSAPPDVEVLQFAEQLTRTLWDLRDLGLEIGELNRAVDEALRRLDDPVRLAFVGDFNAGKSSVINAILSAEGLSPVGQLPETAIVTHMRHGEMQKARLVDQDGKVEEVFIKDAQALIAHQQNSPELKKRRAKLRHVEFILPSEMLRDVTLVDTPGLRSQNAEDDRRTLAHLVESDAVCWVFDANRGGASAQELATIWDAGSSLKLNACWGLLNKAEQKAPSERKEIVKALRDAAPALRGVFVYSATQATALGAGNGARVERIQSDLDFDFVQKILQAVRHESVALRARRCMLELIGVVERTLGAISETDATWGTVADQAHEDVLKSLRAERESHVERAGLNADSMCEQLVHAPRAVVEDLKLKFYPDGKYFPDAKVDAEGLAGSIWDVHGTLRKVFDEWLRRIKDEEERARATVQRVRSDAQKADMLPAHLLTAWADPPVGPIEYAPAVALHDRERARYTAAVVGGLRSLLHLAQEVEGVRELFVTRDAELTMKLIAAAGDHSSFKQQLKSTFRAGGEGQTRAAHSFDVAVAGLQSALLHHHHWHDRLRQQAESFRTLGITLQSAVDRLGRVTGSAESAR